MSGNKQVEPRRRRSGLSVKRRRSKPSRAGDARHEPSVTGRRALSPGGSTPVLAWRVDTRERLAGRQRIPHDGSTHEVAWRVDGFLGVTTRHKACLAIVSRHAERGSVLSFPILSYCGSAFIKCFFRIYYFKTLILLV